MKKKMKGILIGCVLLVICTACSPNENDEELATKAPTVTESPKTTEAPIPTEAPKATEAPIPTEAPKATETPIPTEAPKATETPIPTEAPKATETPIPTEAPKATETPIPTEAPKATETPIPTETPKTTEAPKDNGSNFNAHNNESQQKTEDTYVLNTSSKKIHHPSCRSVKKIAPENYATSSSSIEELISQGYSTCGICF